MDNSMEVLEATISIMEHKVKRVSHVIDPVKFHAIVERSKNLNVGQMWDIKFKFSHQNAEFMLSMSRVEENVVEVDRYNPITRQWQLEFSVRGNEIKWEYL